MKRGRKRKPSQRDNSDSEDGEVYPRFPNHSKKKLETRKLTESTNATAKRRQTAADDVINITTPKTTRGDITNTSAQQVEPREQPEVSHPPQEEIRMQPSATNKLPGDELQPLHNLLTRVFNILVKVETKVNSCLNGQEDIKLEINLLKQTFNRFGSETVEETFNEVANVKKDLPLKDMNAVNTMETKLNDSNYRNNLGKYIGSIGGNELKNSVSSVMNALFTNEVGQSFNWTGKKKKKPFSVLSITALIIEVIEKRTNKPNGETRYDIQLCIQDWLRYSKDRFMNERTRNNRDRSGFLPEMPLSPNTPPQNTPQSTPPPPQPQNLAPLQHLLQHPLQHPGVSFFNEYNGIFDNTNNLASENSSNENSYVNL